MGEVDIQPRDHPHTHTHTHTSSPQTQEAENTPPSIPTSPSSTGAGGDRGRGCRPPAFRDEARESKHSGYLASKIQRF